VQKTTENYRKLQKTKENCKKLEKCEIIEVVKNSSNQHKIMNIETV